MTQNKDKLADSERPAALYEYLADCLGASGRRAAFIVPIYILPTSTKASRPRQ